MNREDYRKKKEGVQILEELELTEREVTTMLRCVVLTDLSCIAILEEVAK